jgi:hypothetical protein
MPNDSAQFSLGAQRAPNAMTAKQALAWVKKCGIAVGVGTRDRSESRSGGSRRTIARQLVGTSEGRQHIPALASDSQFSRRFGMPTGRWKNYLHPSASVGRPRFIRRTIFQAETCSLERSAHACGQAQVTGHSISRLGADRSPASRREADRERGCFTIGGRPVTFELNMNMPPNKCALRTGATASPAGADYIE